MCLHVPTVSKSRAAAGHVLGTIINEQFIASLGHPEESISGLLAENKRKKWDFPQMFKNRRNNKSCKLHP